jgi:putative Mn2+ efflux pump MntP
MNTFEIIILALALVCNSWITYLNAGILLKHEPLSRKAYYVGIMLLLQFFMAGAGIWIGYKVSSTEVQVNMLISLSILLFAGLKVLLLGILVPNPDKVFNFENNIVLLFAALAEGIFPLVVGLAIGLLTVQPCLHWFLVGVFLLTGIVAGLFQVRRLGANFLFKVGAVGGLLFLAAAIKLALNLTRFWM